MFTCLHYEYRYPRTQITSGGLGTMGFCLPAAMGIAIQQKRPPSISINGDGGFQMNMQELATIRTYSIPVKIMIFNNNNLGMVKQWQDFFWEKRYASTIFDQNPDFINSLKLLQYTCDKSSKKIKSRKLYLLKSKGPFLVEFRIDPECKVDVY